MTAKKRVRRRLSDEDKRAMIERVENLITQGTQVTRACKDVGVLNSQYYDWKARGHKGLKIPKQKKSKPYNEEISAELPRQRVACIIGSPIEIGEVLRGMK